MPTIKRQIQNETDTEVNTAINGLESAVTFLLDRFERRHPDKPLDGKRQRVRRIIKHMRHCLTQLRRKQESLENGLSTLLGKTWPAVLEHIRASDLEYVSVLLQHFFTQLLRLHDGLILCVSGECRHPADVKQASSTKYPSQLAQAGTRADGYTRLYSTGCTYSGASWDEFMDPTAGLQMRLVQELKPIVKPSQRDFIWEELLIEERGAHAMENLLSNIEFRMQQVQQEFSRITQNVQTQLKRTLIQTANGAVSVNISLADKLEKLHVSVGSWAAKYERRGQDFMVLDEFGVLPHPQSVKWEQIMRLPERTLKQKNNERNVSKRRKVIAESDEENDVVVAMNNKRDQEKKKTGATGLVVQVKETKKQESEITLLSVKDIKQSLGVDGERLASARDLLESEEAGTKREAEAVDSMPADETSDLDERVIKESEARVKRLRRVLRDVLLRNDDGEEEWDARECLREALMTAGNYLLWVDDASSSKHYKDLERSLSYFVEAQKQVEAQQELQSRMTTKHALPVADANFFERNLLLLKSRAMLNAAIAQIKLALLLNERDSRRSRHLVASCSVVDCALQCASVSLQVTNELMTGDSDSSVTVEAALHSLKVKQQLSMVHRWKATGLWHLGRYDDSRKEFLAGSEITLESAGSSRESPMNNSELLESELDVLAEKYYSLVTMVDLSSKQLEIVSAHGIRQKSAHFESLYSLTVMGLEKSASISHEISSRVESIDDCAIVSYCCDRDIRPATELVACRNEMALWWQQRKSHIEEPILKRSGIEPLPHRAELGSIEPPPSMRLLLKNSTKSQKKWGRIVAGVQSNAAIREQINVPEPPRYRRWGDDLLPQVKDKHGKLCPKLEFPSIAPEMPEEIRAYFERCTVRD